MQIKTYKPQNSVDVPSKAHTKELSKQFEQFLIRAFMQCGYSSGQIRLYADQGRISRVTLDGINYYCIDDVKIFHTITRHEVDRHNHTINTVIGIERLKVNVNDFTF